MKRPQESTDMESAAKRKKTIPSQGVLHSSNCTLHQSICHTDYQGINTELEKGERLCSGYGLTCFYLAHQTGNWNLVKKLLDHDPSGALSRSSHEEPYLFAFYPHHFDFLYEFGATSSSCNMCLLQAVKKRGPLDLVQRMIDLGISLEERDEEGKTAIMYALIYRDKILARHLISAGADIEAVDSEGSTVLMYAILQHFSTDFVENLVKLSKDISAQNNSGDTAFLLACQKGSFDLVQILLTSGAIVSVQNKKGKSPLMAATERGCPEIIKILLAAGADLNSTDFNFETALFKVTNEESFLLLLQAGSNPKALNKNGDSVLMFLVARYPQLLGCIKLLLEAGVKPSTQNNSGYTPLMEACNHSECEYLDIVKMFIVKGGDPSRQNKDGLSALSYAISWGYLDTVKLLLSASANPSPQDNNGISLLMQVCRYDVESIDMLSLLLETGANVSAQDNEGRTALMFAVEYNHTNFVRRLLKAGANSSAQDKNGKSALIQVCSSIEENMEYVNILLEAGVNVSTQTNLGKTALMHALKRGHHTIIGTLLKHGANLCSQDCHGRNVLIITCDLKLENVALVKSFLKCGISLSAQDEHGQTALMIALQQGHFEICKLLIQAGSNVSIQDNNGNTILMMACSRNIDIVKLLLKTGANVSPQNKAGETAAIIAASGNNLDVLCLLLKAGASAVSKDNNNNSIVFHVFANRINDQNQIHPDFELTLKHIIKFSVKVDNISIVYEVVTVFLKFILGHYSICVLLFQGFLKQLIEAASDMFKLRCLTMQRQSDAHKLLMDTLNDTRKNISFDYIVEIFDIIAQSPFKDVNWTGSFPTSKLLHYAHYGMLETEELPCQTVGVIIESYYTGLDCFLTEETFNELWATLQNLFDSGFSVNSSDPQVMSPLTVLLGLLSGHDDEEEMFFKIALDFFARGITKFQQLLCFDDNRLALLSQQLQLPDALWLAFVNGKNRILPLLLPYWSAPPLALLMFLPPELDFESEFQTSNLDMLLWDTETAFDILLEVGGPLPPGHEFIRAIQSYIDSFPITFDCAIRLSESFRQAHNTAPPSLKQLCRHVIRGCAQSGDDLPEQLSSLVPPGLQSFITLINNK